MASSIGVICESTAMPPIAAMTDVSPRNSGTSAATSAPNARKRMTSVTGSEISSAVRSSRVTTSPIALSVVPGPAAWTVTLRVLGLELRRRWW